MAASRDHRMAEERRRSFIDTGGGTIELASTSENGTTFKGTLPCV